MKRMLVISMLVLCAGILTAQEKATEGPPRPLNEWTFFQLGFFPEIPGNTMYSNVYGIKLGAPMVCGYGRVYGVEPSFLYSGTDYVKGIQAAWVGFSDAKEVYGLQASMGVCMADKVWGIQTGAVCIAKKTAGIQFSGVGVTETSSGIQAGIVNVSNYVKGLQLGAFNWSKEGAFQIGAVNMIEDSWLPFMIIFNVSFKERK